MTDHSFPTPEQYQAFAASVEADDGPIVMLNLNHYRDRAEYADGRDVGEMTGREAYASYGVVAQRCLEAVGGKVLWATTADTPVIGCEHDEIHDVLAVWYPSRSAFLEFTTDPEILAAFEHRRAGLEEASIICCESGPDAALSAN